MFLELCLSPRKSRFSIFVRFAVKKLLLFRHTTLFRRCFLSSNLMFFVIWTFLVFKNLSNFTRRSNVFPQSKLQLVIVVKVKLTYSTTLLVLIHFFFLKILYFPFSAINNLFHPSLEFSKWRWKTCFLLILFCRHLQT